MNVYICGISYNQTNMKQEEKRNTHTHTHTHTHTGIEKKNESYIYTMNMAQLGRGNTFNKMGLARVKCLKNKMDCKTK